MQHNTQHPEIATTCGASGSDVLPLLLPEPTENGVAEKRGSKGGAPTGNQNAARFGLTGGGWRPEWEQDRRRVNRFMRALESAVLATGGVLDIPTVATIQTAGRLERVARLANRAARTDASLSQVEIVDLGERAAKASRERDKCLRELRIEDAPRSADDDIDALLAAERLLSRHKRRQDALTIENGHGATPSGNGTPEPRSEAPNGNK
jgi:hypothetical protein